MSVGGCSCKGHLLQKSSLKEVFGLTVICFRTGVLGPYQPRMEPLQQGQETIPCQPGAQQTAVRPQPATIAHRQAQGESQ